VSDGTCMRAAYAEAVFDVEAPDGTATLSVGRPSVDLPPSLHGRRLAVVTAYNPGAKRPGEEVNSRVNDLLRVVIEAAGWSYLLGVGRSPSGDHAEPSFAVIDISDEQAKDLGARFDQACVFYWDGARGRLVWCA
jgi:hypothetical protein